MKTKFLLPFIFLFSLAASCQKEDPAPPPQPFENCGGEPRDNCANCQWNVFRCKVNGVEWCANCEADVPLVFGCDPVDCQYYPDTKSLGALATNDRYYSTIRLGTERSIVAGDTSHLIRGVFGSKDNCSPYKFDTTSIAYMYIYEIDVVKKIIEGSFEFTGISLDCTDTVRITNGYFKLTYRP